MEAQQRTRTGPGRPPKGEAGPTRVLLLDAALELFAERGFAATTVRQIARKVGVTDAAIYFHFSGKQAILDALMDEAGPPLLLHLGIDPEVLGEQDPEDVIPASFQRLVKAWDEPRVRLFTSMLLRHTPERISEALSDVQAWLVPVMQSWAERGLVRDDVSPELLTWELLSPLATIRLTLLHGRASEAQRKLARSIAAQHLDYWVQTNVRTS